MIVVGGGLAGLSAALSLVDRGASVLLLEKEAFLGGNSAWASSGINAVSLVGGVDGDTVDAYEEDTLKSGGLNTSMLVRELTHGSGAALQWLRERVGLSLDQVGFTHDALAY